jgi:hypothetical protein
VDNCRRISRFFGLSNEDFENLACLVGPAINKKVQASETQMEGLDDDVGADGCRKVALFAIKLFETVYSPRTFYPTLRFPATGDSYHRMKYL